MPIHHMQATFAGGEWAPSLHSRIDLARYSTGLKKARNCFIHPHGGCSNRAGLRFINETQTSSKRSRLVEFIFSTTQAYMLEFGEGYIRFHKDGAQIPKSSPAAWLTATVYDVGDFVVESATTYYCIVAHTSGVFAADLTALKWRAQTAYEIPTEFTLADVTGMEIKYVQSADVLYLFHPDHNPMQLTRTAHDNWTIADYDYTDGPFMLSNTNEALTITTTARAWATATAYAVGDVITQGSDIFIALVAHTSGVFATDLAASKWQLAYLYGGPRLQLAAASALFVAGQVGALWRINQPITNQTIQKSFTAANQTSAVINAGTAWRWSSTGSWSGKIMLQKSTDNGVTWTIIRSFTSNVDTFGETGEEQCLLRAAVNPAGITIPEAPPAWSGTALVDLSANDFIWIGIVRITAVNSPTSAFATALTDVAAGTISLSLGTPTDDWAEGSWSDYRGWPSTGSFYSDRLFAAATEAEPSTAWATETSLYTSYKRSRPLVDSDGISVRMPSQKVNAIRNLLPLGDLLSLTSADDWIITSANGIMTPTTVNTRPQGFRGSSVLAPVIVGNRAIVIAPQGQVVRDLGFSDSVQGAYTGQPISIISNHLFQGYEIVGMVYAQEPDSLVWLVRNDGVFLSLTYLPEQEVLAWTRHDTDGEVESIATIPGDGHDEVWMIVKRNINGVTKRYIERMDPRMVSRDTADQFFVDCGLTLDNPITISAVSSANPVVIGATAHGRSNGQKVDLRDIVWAKDAEGNRPDHLNQERFKVANASANSFELNTLADAPVDGSTFAAYESGGTVRLVVSTVSGLDHLEGEEVTVFANGFVQPKKIVSGGSITLSKQSSIVHVGLSYKMQMATLPIEIAQRDGTLQGRKVKISEVRVRYLDSLGGLVGPSDGFVLDPLIIRDGDNSVYGKPTPLQTGERQISFQAGWEDSGEILIEQSDPLPLTVLALIPRVQPGG